mmetsp:Transcript_14244/g.32933  ORF Transcript_14244/g.32933 Transcript_14244/m.32933 type:complete len:83 (+) Transcript_14244:34-282(+)
MLFHIVPGSQLVNTFAGYNTPENSSVTPGMGLHRDLNTYYYPSSLGWSFRNYDMDGSYTIPEVSAYNSDGGFSGVGANFLIS